MITEMNYDCSGLLDVIISPVCYHYMGSAASEKIKVAMVQEGGVHLPYKVSVTPYLECLSHHLREKNRLLAEKKLWMSYAKRTEVICRDEKYQR